MPSFSNKTPCFMQNPSQFSSPCFNLVDKVGKFCVFSHPTDLSANKVIFLTPFITISSTIITLFASSVMILETVLKGICNILFAPLSQKCHWKTGVNFLFLRTPISVLTGIKLFIFQMIGILFSPFAMIAAMGMQFIKWKAKRCVNNTL